MNLSRWLIAAIPVLLGLAPPAAAPAPKDFADPFVVRAQGAYFAFATASQGRNVQVARSDDDLATWTLLADALPVLPIWASREPGLTWAPSVLARGAGFVLYYTTRDAASGFQCLSRARSSRAEGPYVDDTSAPLVCQVTSCGSIDPSPFVDDGGRAHLLWKSDENSAACRTPSRLWSQELSADGLSLVGEPVELLAFDRPWESPLVEGPSMFLRDRVYHLFYSAGWYDSAGYAIGYARCAGPRGPCEKITKDAPLVRSAGAVLGPGGQELFEDERGQAWMAYHGWSAPKSRYADGGARALRLARVTFTGALPVVAPR